MAHTNDAATQILAIAHELESATREFEETGGENLQELHRDFAAVDSELTSILNDVAAINDAADAELE